ncbi:hypothetical protein JRO89_XS08G0219600 [Xanthoceras sorbifolium]|uniref:Uncharacterized protein n=1 Tax=Xanthoceras sorbifolium TaxID=99658 RepID=A0ABQ8HQY0_9ROSI|nr:hypothetical protein JRO89_XS08G0219600 [Xanthoceras sorbifolium]
MDSAKPIRSSVFILRILLIAFSFGYPFVSATELHSLVVGQNITLQLSPGLVVENSPGSKSGIKVVCGRVNIHGLSRLKNLKKFAHSIKVKVSQNSSILRRPNAEVCFHRNESLGVGMCPQGRWEKVSKGLWVQSMSPFDHKLLDVRTTSSFLETFEVSVEEEFFLYRVIFLILGIILLSLASTLSKSLVFYYGSAMAVGVILVILVVLFQGMKLLPTGRKSSLAIFMYSSLVGLGSFLLRYVPGLLRSILAEIGINEDMYNPVLNSGPLQFTSGILQFTVPTIIKISFSGPQCGQIVNRGLANFLLAFVVMAGAWMGFLVVRKLVLTEDGSVDISTSNFVAWSIRILAVVMILQSSLDPLLAAEALISGIVVSSVLRRVLRLRFLRHVFKKLFKLVKNFHSHSEIPDLSPLQDIYEEYLYKRPEDYKSIRSRSKRFSMVSCSSPGKGITRTSPSQLSDTEIFPSTFHTTPERRKISKEEWGKFTKDSTKRAVEELASSPDFSKWVAANADRITVTPNKTSSDSSSQRRKWLFSF